LNLAKIRRKRIISFVAISILPILFIAPSFANATSSRLHIPSSAGGSIGTLRVAPLVTMLSSTFDPQKGGVPFCDSLSVGSILCYSPDFIKTAYNFPTTQGHNGLDGQGSTIVIVDAFGSPTIQSDLDTFDKTFGLPSTRVQILCGPTWTGASNDWWKEESSDTCPVKTVADLTSAPNAVLCGATGWAEETTLDVTMSHALAPGAKIVLVVANDCFDTSFNNAEMAVVTQDALRGSIMSQSFGSPDDAVGCLSFDPITGLCTATDPSIKAVGDQIYQIATDNQWTVIASSGDDGANENTRFGGGLELTPSWPASNPLNLAAGGTQGLPYGGNTGAGTFPGPGGSFSCAAHTTCNTGLVVINGGKSGCKTALRPGEPTSCFPVGYGGEGTWAEYDPFNNFFGGDPFANGFIGIGRASGGGVSSIYSMPSYQSGLPSSFTTLFGATVPANGRMNPDVSFNAASNGGWLAPLSFLPPSANSKPTFPQWAVFGGTSASAPAWAGIIALLNQANGGPVGFINPAIYSLGNSWLYHDAFHDITSGQNSDFGSQAALFGADAFNGQKGYDLTTGWGTPNVSHFIQDIQGFLSEGEG
jgi:subtilase family serine protease